MTPARWPWCTLHRAPPPDFYPSSSHLLLWPPSPRCFLADDKQAKCRSCHMDDVPCAICSCSGVKEVAGRWDLEPNDTYKGLMHHQRFFFGCKLSAHGDPKQSSATRRNDFCEEKAFEVAIFRRKKNRIRVMYNAIAKD